MVFSALSLGCVPISPFCVLQLMLARKATRAVLGYHRKSENADLRSEKAQEEHRKKLAAQVSREVSLSLLVF